MESTANIASVSFDQVSSIASTANLSYLAVGLVSGQVLLYRHVSESLTTSPQAITSFPKARTVWEGSLAEPITGLGFRDPLSPIYEDLETDGDVAPKAKQKEREAKVVTSLFITTTNKTIVIPSVTGRGTEPRILEENEGSGLGCAVMDGNARDLIVGREEGIYLYGLEGRGAVLAYEGLKASIHSHGQSLVIVSPPFTSTANSNSNTVRRAAVTTDASSAPSAKVTVFDLTNKFLSHSAVYKHGIQHVLTSSPANSNNSPSGSTEIDLLLGDGSLTRLSEISTQAKIEALYRKNLYTLAGAVAKSEGMDEQGIKDIWARYGDYLYTKGDFEGAIAQFVKTLGFLQPSYVIRKVSPNILKLTGRIPRVSTDHWFYSSLMHNGYRTSLHIFRSCMRRAWRLLITLHYSLTVIPRRRMPFGWMPFSKQKRLTLVTCLST